MAKNVAVDNEFPSEGLEPSFISDRTRADVRTEGESDGVLPTPERIIFGEFHSINVGHKEWIYVNVVRVDGAGAVLDSPLFLGAERDHMFNLSGELLIVDTKATLIVDASCRQWCIVERFEIWRWQVRGI